MLFTRVANALTNITLPTSRTGPEDVPLLPATLPPELLQALPPQLQLLIQQRHALPVAQQQQVHLRCVCVCVLASPDSLCGASS